MIDETIDGGPAFPAGEFHYVAVRPDGTQYGAVGVSRGMSLRDWFAGQALLALATEADVEVDDAARHAYRYADAMLAEREKR